jgi:hypothetical protein
MYKCTNVKSLRTVHLVMTGLLSDEEMAAFTREFCAATDSYGGQPHLVLADMRGLKTLSPAAGKVLGDAIGYARSHGVVRCAHLADHSITRLQTARLARQASPTDDVTIDCVSLEEAERLLSEERMELRVASR